MGVEEEPFGVVGIDGAPYRVVQQVGEGEDGLGEVHLHNRAVVAGSRSRSAVHSGGY